MKIALVNGVRIHKSKTPWRMVWDVFQMCDQTEILLIQVPTGSGSIEVIGNAMRDVMGRSLWCGHALRQFPQVDLWCGNTRTF